MKHALMIALVLLFSACKIETQKSTPTESASQALTDNQIALEADVNNSEEIARFKEELERKQAENPDQIFEVVSKEVSSGSVILSGLKDDHLYKNKNFYIFIGLGSTENDQTIQKTDWDAIYYIMNYVTKLKFRVMINVQATSEHLKLAASDEETSVILWSSHGNKKAFYDFDGKAVPYDVFKGKSKNFYQLILSSCEGRIALNNNYAIDGLKTWAWSGLTNSTELKQFLVSDKWSAQDGAILSTPKNNVTCTASGSKYALMKASTRSEYYGYNFDSLNDCNARIQTMKNNKICSRGDEGIRKVDINTLTLSNEEYATFEECMN
ncbi:hypothetical protein C0V70_07965 [Bacteriovorax stolpii]|uniref:Uncharacterized protein n=1 Tax=Bacteriovorax stolpii TaxID=960 RepID=A0A2K9NTG9_BACTC|nr:hypothetical protein [Bacteriovorax stolpii]AUN98044.1 hypothetical protein C0V70_07965 [Bacteriovorax stolpii]TDP50266.1 hypothetical protein C8D79_3769 [Bacteriovorax stolpii]